MIVGEVRSTKPQDQSLINWKLDKLHWQKNIDNIIVSNKGSYFISQQNDLLLQYSITK